MTHLPDTIKYIFYKTLFGEISVVDFEQWIYQLNELESVFSPDDYLEIISYNYKQKAPKYGLTSIIKRHIDLGDYETWKLKKLLHSVEQKQGDYPIAITDFYNLNCSGYGFLDNLAFGYGLPLDCPWNKYGVDSFEQLTKEQQIEFADSFYPEIIVEINRVLDWINSGQIILTGVQNDIRQFEYIDNRKDEDMAPTTYKSELVISKPKKWWQIWNRK